MSPLGRDDGGYQGWQPDTLIQACREIILEQSEVLGNVVQSELRPRLREHGIALHDYGELSREQAAYTEQYYRENVHPILTPLAVDAEHPFPFISNLGLNLAIVVTERARKHERFVRLKVPGNRPRWVPLPEGGGFVPLEQVIASHLHEFFPEAGSIQSYIFRVTRGEAPEDAGGNLSIDDDDINNPGAHVSLVASRLQARRFAGATRLQVAADMPAKLQHWLAEQLELTAADIYPNDNLVGKSALSQLPIEGHMELRFPPLVQASHPRLKGLPGDDPAAFFEAVREGDILVHHPYQSFDNSVLRFIQSAAVDPAVLAIKITIYRTSSDSPVIRALIDAARRGKQVAVLMEITARFDEDSNIHWGQVLEREGVHVAYGIEKLKTHLKLCLVVREEEAGVRRYVHSGTGNYHTGTARAYEDLGIFTCDTELAADVADVFNELTSATDYHSYRKLVVAPDHLRTHFTDLIRREALNAQAGLPSGIRAKMNQLSDGPIIRELYQASQAGVPITLDVRGLCCLRPGVPGLSDNIRVFSIVGRFLEHSRIYRFTNGGDPRYYIGSADWMHRNLDRRVESITPVSDPALRRQLDYILEIYEDDNTSAWDLMPDGDYIRRHPEDGEHPTSAQQRFIELASF
jgi:polyphosphate kinase